MKITASKQNNITILSLLGRMDATTVNEFEKACQAQFKNNINNIIINLAELEYISSAGLRGILLMQKTCLAAKGTLAFCSMQTMVAEVFRISGFNAILPVHNTLDEAIAALS